jgi:hypothetical protein
MTTRFGLHENLTGGNFACVSGDVVTPIHPATKLLDKVMTTPFNSDVFLDSK